MPLKVMIVDDDDDMVTLLQLTLENEDRYELLTAREGLEALVVARRERPDVVFLDVSMPNLDGFQVCQAIKADPATAHAKVVVLTAMAQERDRRKAEEIGADDFFTKPFSPTALLDKLEELLSRLTPRECRPRDRGLTSRRNAKWLQIDVTHL